MQHRDDIRGRILRSLIREPAADAPLHGAPTGDHDLDPGWQRPATAKPLTPAAVLVPLVERALGPTVLLTRRTAHLQQHAGQISFPGGRFEPDDGHLLETALRETEEEIGLNRSFIEVAGFLDAYETGTGYRVTPVVGFIKPGFALTPDPFEVAEIFEVPLGYLFDPVNHQRHSRTYDGRQRQYYAMPYGDYYIWGATAGMLMNFYRRVYTPR